MSRSIQNKAYLTILIIITLGIWLASKWWYGDTFPDYYKYAAKAASLSATICMSLSLLLSARFRWLENIFGGLDKIYQLHKFTGKTAFYLILLHPLFLSLRKLPNLYEAITFWGLQSPISNYQLGHSVGVFALLLMTCLIALSLWIKIPYRLWKRTHEYFGLVYILVAIHIVLVNADIARYPLLAAWMYGWLAIGIASFIYIRFLYTFIGPKYSYTVESVKDESDTLELRLHPTRRDDTSNVISDKNKLIYRPSQFVYIRFDHPGIDNDLHPFSIASSPDSEGKITLGIKKLGDFTRSLTCLKEGDSLKIFGPYGRFSESFLNTREECIFIGGGIGITPFLGMWDMALNSDELVGYNRHSRLITFDFETVKAWKSPRVHLFYVVNEIDEASFDERIKQSAIRSKFNGFEEFSQRGHSYELYASNTKGRITAHYIASTHDSITNKQIFLCGPKPMMEALIKQFTDMGVDRERIHTENFNLVNQQFQLTPPQLRKLAERTKKHNE